MRIGFRADEAHRAFEWEIKEKDTIKFPLYTKYKKNSGEPMKLPLKQWTKIHWRKCRFPLIDDDITKTDVNEFWKNKPLTFPLVSNCIGCFFHSDSELALNWQIETDKMQYFADLEKISGRRFKKDKTYEDIKYESLFIESFGEKSCRSGQCGI